MTENQYKGFDLKAEALIRLETCVRRFRDRPSQKYLEEVAAEFAKRLKLPEIERYLFELEKRHERFPTMLAIDASLKKIEQDRWRSANPERTAIVRKKTEPFRRVPGTPISAEALFEMIKGGRQDSGAFRFAREGYSSLTDDELWSCYEWWCEGKINPLILGQRPPDARSALASAFSKEE